MDYFNLPGRVSQVQAFHTNAHFLPINSVWKLQMEAESPPSLLKPEPPIAEASLIIQAQSEQHLSAGEDSVLPGPEMQEGTLCLSPR